MEVDTNAYGVDSWEDPVVVKTGINSEEMAVTYRHFGTPKHGWIENNKAFNDGVQISLNPTNGIRFTTSRDNTTNVFSVYAEPAPENLHKIMIQQLEP